MKVFTSFAIFAMSIVSLLAENAYVFSITKTEELAKDSCIGQSTIDTTVDKTNCIVHGENVIASVSIPKKKTETKGEVFVNKTGVVLLEKSNDVFTKISIYKAGEYYAENIKGGQNPILLRTSKAGVIDFSSKFFLFATVNSNYFLESLRGFATSKNKMEISDSSIQYCDSLFHYFWSLKDNKIVSIDVKNHNTSALFSKVSFDYGKDNSKFPKQVRVEIYSGETVVGKLVYSFELIKSFSSDMAEKNLFDTSDLGEFNFMDTRFKPIKNYRYAKGVPSYEEADAMWGAEGFVVKPNEQKKKSAYVERVLDFFKSVR